MINQIKFLTGNAQNEFVDFCREKCLQVEGFPPLATGVILANVDVSSMADRYCKSVFAMSYKWA